MGLAVGIDYSLFMVGRFRQELAAGAEVGAAVERTVARAGRAIFFSGLAVVVALLGLMSFPYMALRSIGLGGAIVVLFSVGAALTLLPALLGTLGPRVNSLRVFYRPGREGRFWRRWSDAVMRRAWLVLIATVALIVLIAWPVAKIQVQVPASLPAGAESRIGYDALPARFDAGVLSPIEVALTWSGGRQSDPFAPANIVTLWGFGRRLEAQPGVSQVTSIVTIPGANDPASRRYSSGKRSAGEPPRVDLPEPAGAPPSPRPSCGRRGCWRRPPPRPASPSSASWRRRRLPTRRPRSGSPTACALSPAVRHYAVGGRPLGRRARLLQLIAARFPWIILFVVVVTYAVLLLFLRSVLLPLKAVIVNGLSLLAAYGALVWVFQFGHLEWLLHFTSTGSVDANIPVLLFCTVFGISMDYEVFLLSRVREEWLASGDNRASVSAGLARTGRIITGAALIVVVVAGSFAFTSILVIKAIGTGLAVAVALDATVVRILMVPAIMRLLGRLNWWCPRGWTAGCLAWAREARRRGRARCRRLSHRPARLLPLAVEAGVAAAGEHELVVAAALDDAALLDHQDLVGVAHRAQTVRDDHRRAAAEEHVHGPRDALLALGVDARGGLVEDEDARVGQQRAREADELPLAGREAAAALLDVGVVAVRQALDEVVHADDAGHAPDLVEAGAPDARSGCCRGSSP